MKYTEFKKQYSEKLNQLLNDCGVFWAFGNEQFELANPNNVKVCSIGGGGYFPAENKQKCLDGKTELKEWSKKTFKQVDKTEAILYELRNHETFYTGDISDTVNALESLGVTAEEIRQVFTTHEEEDFAF